MAITPGTEKVLDAARHWAEVSLLGHRSVFTGEATWTPETFDEIERFFVRDSSDRRGRFIERLVRQLEPAEDRTKRLAAEILWVMMLFPSNIGRAKKLNLIRTIWESSGEQFPEEHLLLGREVLRGVGSGGAAYNARRPDELKFFVHFLQRFNPALMEGDLIASDGWSLALWLDGIPGASTRQFRHMLLHLLFPQTFERVSSGTQKRKIVSVFGHLVSGEGRGTETSREPNVVRVDRRLLEIRRALEARYPGQVLDFYDPPLREQWLTPNQSIAAEIPTEPALYELVKFRSPATGTFIARPSPDSPPYVTQGSTINPGQSLCSLRVGNTIREVPASETGTIHQIRVSDGQAVEAGDTLFVIEVLATPRYRTATRPERRFSDASEIVAMAASMQQPSRDDSLEWENTEEEEEEESRDELPLTPYAEPDFPIIIERVTARGARFTEGVLRSYHLALKSPRQFVLLTGISGTGKSWLAEAYAEAVGAHYTIIPVAPNWTTNEDLLGFLNPLDGNYHDTELSAFLREAARHYERAQTEEIAPRPYHIILDEMNLARVEHYFARLLSAMEIRARHGHVTLSLAVGDTVLLPPNVAFIGTVNVDETTHGFADKVYDRAQVIEIEIPRDALQEHLAGRPYAESMLRIWDALIGTAPFAFRVIDDIGRYHDQGAALGATWQDLIDDQILQKILPKIRGSNPSLSEALAQLEEITAPLFPRSHARVHRMREAFDRDGMVSFHG